MSIYSAQCQCYKTLLLTSSCQILGRILRVFLQRSDQFQFGGQGHFLFIYRPTVFFIPPPSKLDHRQTHLRLQENQPTSIVISSNLDDWLKGTNIDLEHRTSVNIEHQERGDQVLQEQKEGTRYHSASFLQHYIASINKWCVIVSLLLSSSFFLASSFSSRLLLSGIQLFFSNIVSSSLFPILKIIRYQVTFFVGNLIPEKP